MSFPEIAEELNISLYEVKKIYNKAIAKLKQDKRFYQLLKLYVEPDINWFESKYE
jgi:DNA-directed RNA polymerase sigma subunit (sigma70/sigma32)